MTPAAHQTTTSQSDDCKKPVRSGLVCQGLEDACCAPGQRWHCRVGCVPCQNTTLRSAPSLIPSCKLWSCSSRASFKCARPRMAAWWAFDWPLRCRKRRAAMPAGFLKKTAYWSNGSRCQQWRRSKNVRAAHQPQFAWAQCLEPTSSSRSRRQRSVPLDRQVSKRLARSAGAVHFQGLAGEIGRARPPRTTKPLPWRRSAAAATCLQRSAASKAGLLSSSWLTRITPDQGNEWVPIWEVHFCVSSDPVADFASKTAPLRLLLPMCRRRLSGS